MRDLNLTFMMKAAWNLCNPPTALWKNVLRAKYDTGVFDFPNINTHKQGSNFWKGICNNWETFRSNLMWQIGNGETTRFWEDHWIFNEVPLINSIIQPLDDNLSQRRVSDYVNGNGNWDRNTLAEFLPVDVLQKILSIPPPNISMPADSLFWKHGPDGSFTTKSAYLAVKKQSNLTFPGNFDMVWKWSGPERLRLFLWKAMHGILLTNSERTRRHLSDCSLCPSCGGHDETLLHVFRDCNRIQLLWNCVNNP